MALHWTYGEFDPAGDLRQGDIIVPNPELLRLFNDIHPRFGDEKYLGFIVLTQTCDLVRSGGRKPKPHISLAVIRSLRSVLPELLGTVCRKQLGESYFDLRERGKCRDLVERVVNQNEERIGLFYLYPDSGCGIGDHAVAFLRVSVAFRVEHYDALVEARKGRLTHEFEARLGWLAGNLFSRVAVRDWTESKTAHTECKRFIASILEGTADDNGPIWVPHQLAKDLTKEGIAEKGRSEMLSIIESHPTETNKDMALKCVEEALRKVVPGLEESHRRRILRLVGNDPVLQSVLRID